MTISAATRVYAVVGDPVRHSLSPIMHNGWIADHGLDAVYVALELKHENPIAALRMLGALGVSGANVTVPFKEAAARAANATDLAVANVLRWDDNRAPSAFNTDGLGFLRALSEAAPDWRVRVRRALVLGAGGAGQGIAQALSPHVEAVYIANRTFARAEEAGALIPNARAMRWDDFERGFGGADLIVQTTTLGMDGQPDQAWPVHACRPDAIMADIVYRPLETPFLKAARARGLLAMDGLGMLIHQAALSFELWFGVMPDTEKARARLLAALRS
jgi:shikimate dehydrogenase